MPVKAVLPTIIQNVEIQSSEESSPNFVGAISLFQNTPPDDVVSIKGVGDDCESTPIAPAAKQLSFEKQ